ncbi:MAG: hypothetical protein CMI96_04395 [Pelagibacteraceae bacterium]|nr:hypothetical protein [Pelagibacteraceae bacterium]
MKLHPKYIDLSLGRLEILLNKLGNPHLKLPTTIHIAGTNGKGSTLNFLRNILINNNYSVHSYISPHLNNFSERIIINNKQISTIKLYYCLKYVKKINSNNPITFFEITTAAAFVLFSKYKADFLLLETGLGGRLDATNIIPKKLFSIITSISIDHEEFLGKSLNKIAKEKLGIINNSKKIIIAKQQNSVSKFIVKKLKNKKNVIFFNKDFNYTKIKNNHFLFKLKKFEIKIRNPKLKGDHQLENASTALASAITLKNMGYKINNHSFNKSVLNTEWPGRLEFVKYKNKIIILDGSHNLSGAKKLNYFLKKNKIKPNVVFGMLNNKKIFEFLKEIKNNINIVFPIKIPNEKNAFTVSEIQLSTKKLNLKYITKDNLKDINKDILKRSNKYILVTGSLYLVGKLREKYL